MGQNPDSGPLRWGGESQYKILGPSSLQEAQAGAAEQGWKQMVIINKIDHKI